jgi:hypothetical protein
MRRGITRPQGRACARLHAPGRDSLVQIHQRRGRPGTPRPPAGIVRCFTLARARAEPLAISRCVSRPQVYFSALAKLNGVFLTVHAYCLASKQGSEPSWTRARTYKLALDYCGFVDVRRAPSFAFQKNLAMCQQRPFILPSTKALDDRGNRNRRGLPIQLQDSLPGPRSLL